MITEDFVSFETAKLLKEKGFSENTICRYADVGGITEKWYDDYREKVVRFNWEEGHLIEPLEEPKDQYEIFGDTILAPTLQMAMKWLREVHHLVIEIEFIDFLEHGEVWLYSIIERKTIKRLTGRDEDFTEHSYEEACESAIKYCLENLI